MNAARATRIAFATLAIAFFAAPIAARVAGVTAESFENRPFAQPPKLSQGWDAFGQTTRFLTDRMPLRAQAVRANTDIWTGVFGTDPRYSPALALSGDQALPFAGTSSQDRDKDRQQAGLGDLQGPVAASTGRKGWLFLAGETERDCANEVPDTAILEKWAALVKTARDGDRTAVMFAVPSKSSVYPEYLPRNDPYKDCALEEKDKLWSLLSKKGPELGVVELRSELMRLKKQLGDELFEVADMHWTTLGALTLVGAALDATDAGIQIEADEIVKRDLVSYTGDLSRASGREETTEHFEYEIVRKEGASRVPGRTVVIGDSFAHGKTPIFLPYFESVRFFSHSDSSAEAINAIRRADHVIFEAYEGNMESAEIEVLTKKLASS